MTAYSKQTWIDGGSEVNAERMGHIEDGIEAAQAAADAAAAGSLSSAAYGTFVVVTKDPTTGFWPASYGTNGVPVYTGGSSSVSARPTNNARVCVAYKGPDPSPAINTTNTGATGMYQPSATAPGDVRIVTP